MNLLHGFLRFDAVLLLYMSTLFSNKGPINILESTPSCYNAGIILSLDSFVAKLCCPP